VAEDIFGGIFDIMDMIFGPLFHLTSDPKLGLLVGVFLVATLVSAIIIAISHRMVDQKRMKELKAEIAKYQKKIKKARDRRDLKRASALQNEMMKYNKEMMGMSLRPMMYTFIPIIVIFTWLRQYEYLNEFIAQNGYLIALPFVIPKFGSTLGWFGWYILCSFPTSILIKKIFKIEGP
jgi:uncharacterized membrane protein (DUF106 family)